MPDWFTWAIESPLTSRFVNVEGCPIHYLLWRGEDEDADQRGLLLVHGGGAHANWWRFIGPFFTRYFRVAALDLSGMGDSGQRERYNAEIRAAEIRAVLDNAGLGRKPFVVGHSFGGYMTMRFGASFGEEIGGAVIVDSPIRRPHDSERISRPGMSRQRIYPSFDEALRRFRLLPAQDCANAFIVEHIARHSLKPVDAGWSWKFDVRAMGTRRWGEPFPARAIPFAEDQPPAREHLADSRTMKGSGAAGIATVMVPDLLPPTEELTLACAHVLPSLADLCDLLRATD